MAAVDPDDDSLQRFVVRRYAYDLERRERRHQVVAAFDNHREFMRLIKRLARDLERRRANDEAIDNREHYTGVVLEPGHRRRHQDGRVLLKAIRHGTDISQEFLERLELPSNMSVLRSEGPTQR